MGLLDCTPEVNDIVINHMLVSCHTALNFNPMQGLKNWYRKDIYIHKTEPNGLELNKLYVHCIALIKFPKDYTEGDKVNVCINFHEGAYWDGIKRQGWKLQINKLSPMNFNSNMYEYIKLFLSEDNILQHINEEAWAC